MSAGRLTSLSRRLDRLAGADRCPHCDRGGTLYVAEEVTLPGECYLPDPPPDLRCRCGRAPSVTRLEDASDA